jgi:hypothetical protein
MAESAKGGRARSARPFSPLTASPATPAAMSAVNAAAGRRRPFQRSPHPPTTAMRGHLTHQAEATRKNAVSGSQRSDCATAIRLLSQSESCARNADREHRIDIATQDPRTFTARAATSSTVTAEIADSRPIIAFARSDSGIVSVGLNAIAFVNET